MEERKVRPTEERKAQPMEERKAQPMEERKVRPTEERKARPMEERKARPMEERKAQLMEERKVQPMEERKAQPMEERKARPMEERKAQLRVLPRAGWMGSQWAGPSAELRVPLMGRRSARHWGCRRACWTAARLALRGNRGITRRDEAQFSAPPPYQKWAQPWQRRSQYR